MDIQNKKVNTGDRVHGNIYQLKLLMLFLYRGVSHKYSFRLGTEIKEANKFDDLVFEYTRSGKKEYRLLQAKHKLDESKKVMVEDFLTKSDGDYSLIKYFFSYHDSKKETLFEEGSIKDVILCTNIDLDFKSLKSAQIQVEKIEGEDDILDTKNDKRQPTRYRFNEEIILLLKPKLQDYNLTRLARRLAVCFLEGKAIQHHQAHFKPYHVALAGEVIDVKTKKFYDRFIKNDNISQEAEKFRKVFMEEINKQSEQELTLDDINKAITNKRNIINDKQVGLNLSKKFGKGKNRSWPDNQISDDEIKDFLNCFVFAANQPNETELGNIIKNEIGKEFDFIAAEKIYNKFFITMLNWLQGKERGKFLTYEEGRKFFEEARWGMPIWFDIKTPVVSFTGRVDELEELHIALQNRGATAISQVTAISGLGGVGKSELARKYVDEHSEDYDNKIVWVNAESYQTLANSFCRLAQDKLGINMKGIQDQQKDMKSIVEDVYKCFSEGKSLFIFDNAERLRTQDGGNEGIDKFLPSLPSNANKPYVLITSRNQKWGDIKVIQLGTFSEREATDLIKKALNIQDDSQECDIQELARVLQCFPLALQQAIAYIRERDIALKNVDSEFRICNYLQRYEEETRKLLDFQFPEDSSDLYTKTTFTTWSVTFHNIKDNPEYGKKAAEILDIIAYTAPDNIPVKMFLGLEHNEERLGDAIQVLKQYSMINSGKEQSLVNVHRLVQQVTRINLKDKNREEETLKNALKLLKKFCDKEKYTDNHPSQCVFYPCTEDAKLSEREIHATYIWRYASKYAQLVKDFYSAYGKGKNTPINLFAICGIQEAIESILRNIQEGELMIKVNEHNEIGYAPIHSAAFNGHKEIVKYLVEEQGVDVDFVTCGAEYTPTFVAVLGNQIDVVQYLVSEKGADPNKAGKNGNVPIHYAALFARIDIIKCLVNNKANILLKDGINRFNVLHYVLFHLKSCRNHLSDVEEIVKYFLEENSVLVKEEDFMGMTALHHAAVSGSARIVKMILGYGVNVNAKSYVCKHSNVLKCSNVLVSHIKGYDNGYTPLHIAAKENHLECVMLLLQKGAIYEAINDENYDPFDMAKTGSEVENLLKTIKRSFEAARNGKKDELIDLLEGKDPDVLKSILSACDHDEKSLLQVAIANKDHNIPKVLTEKLKS